MAEFPAMPLWTDAYLADTLDLNAEEHGVYLVMLMLAWRRPDDALPNDMPGLKRMLSACASNMHGNRFNRVVPKILERFWTLNADGKWHQKRLGKQKDFLRKSSGKQRDRANKRWAEARLSNDLADATVRAVAMPSKSKSKEETQSPSTQPETLPPLSAQETTSPSQTSPPLGGNGHAKPKSQVKGTRLSENWRPKDDAIRHCRENLGASNEILNREYEAFMDWGLSACGQVALKRDWDRAFINWIRRVMNGIREQEARERRWAEQRASKH